MSILVIFLIHCYTFSINCILTCRMLLVLYMQLWQCLHILYMCKVYMSVGMLAALFAF